jgi:hypothetical protein
MRTGRTTPLGDGSTFPSPIIADRSDRLVAPDASGSPPRSGGQSPARVDAATPASRSRGPGIPDIGSPGRWAAATREEPRDLIDPPGRATQASTRSRSGVARPRGLEISRSGDPGNQFAIFAQLGRSRTHRAFLRIMRIKGRGADLAHCDSARRMTSSPPPVPPAVRSDNRPAAGLADAPRDPDLLCVEPRLDPPCSRDDPRPMVSDRALPADPFTGCD